MTTLIITLPAALNADNLTSAQLDYVLSPDGKAVASQSRAALSLLPPLPNGECVALVPVHALSWHSVRLPRGTLSKGFMSDGGSPRLRAILEGLLEDHLLDEPANLHFALEPGARDETQAWVAVCDRAWLRNAVQALERAGRPVARIVPEFSPGAQAGAANEATGNDAARTLFVLGTPEAAFVVFARQADALGAGAAGAPVAAPSTGTGLMHLPLSSSTVALAAWPEGAPILAEPAVAALAESLFKRRVDLLQSGKRCVQAAQTQWDLAQFDLVNSSGARTWKRVGDAFAALAQAPRWKAARWAAVALVGANLLGLNAWAWKEKNDLLAKRQAVNDVLTSTFPSVKLVLDAPVQMMRELALLRQASGGSARDDFETLLASFDSIAPANKGATAIEYVANQLRMKGVAVPPEQLAQGAQRLQRLGLAARAEGDAVTVSAQGAP